MENIKRQRIRLALAAYMYERLNESFMSDADWDKLAIEVYNNRYIPTDNVLYDNFFKDEVNPSTGMWVHKHPDTINGKLYWLSKYVKTLIGKQGE